jgi:hypothetical protein
MLVWDGGAAKPLGHATQFRKVMSLVGAAWWCRIAKRVPGFASLRQGRFVISRVDF